MRALLRILKTGWVDWLFIIGLIWLLTCLVRLVRTQPPNITEWLLVYLTGIYALFTLYLALVAVKSALATERSAAAAERSAAAMEASITESQLGRIAQFGAVFRFTDPQRCYRRKDGSVIIRIQNPFGQPMVDFTTYLWSIENNTRGEPEVRYGSMMESQPRAILATDLQVDMILAFSRRPESECRQLGELALERYKEVFRKMPEHSLCLITYNDRANIGIAPSLFVWDLQVVDLPSSDLDQRTAELIKRLAESHAKKQDS